MKLRKTTKNTFPGAAAGQPQETFTRRERIVVLGIVLASLALRFLYHFEMRGNILVEHLQLDEQFHDRWARSIAAGNLIGEGVFFRAPLYPYILGLFYFVFGNIPEIPRIAQHLLGSLMVFLTYLLGRSLFGKRTAIIASLMCTLYSVVIYFEGRILFDFLVTFLMLLWLTLVATPDPKHAWQRQVLFGLLFGLICTLRPPFLPVALILFGYMIWKSLKTGMRLSRSSLPLVCSFLLPILIVTAHNILVGKDFVLLASQGGINFYIGNNGLSDGYTSSVPEAGGPAWETRHVEYIVERDLGRTPKPSEVSGYWYAKGFDFIRSNPGDFIRLTLRKVYLFWSHIEIANNQSYYWYEQSSTLLRVLPVGFWLVGPLGLAGAVLAWTVPRARVLLLFLLIYFLVTISFFVCDRFRLPVIPPLCLLAGYTTHQALTWFRAKSWSSLTLTVILIAAAGIFVNTNAFHVQPHAGSGGADEVRALASLEAGNFAMAAELFGRVGTLDKTNSGARVNQGIAFWQMGRMQEAAAAFHAGMGRNPYPALINLAHLYFTLGLPDSVQLYADRAIEASSFAPGGYIIAAKNFIAQGKIRQAEFVLLRGRAACGDDFVVGDFLLAGVSMQDGRYATADSLYRSILSRTRNRGQSDYALQSEKAQFGEDLGALYSKTLHARGRFFAMQEQLDSSEVYLRAAAALLPSKAEVWADLGICLFRMNRIQEADSALGRAVRLDGNNPWVWLNYAGVLAQEGKPELALPAVSRALSLKPELDEARNLKKTLDEILRRKQHARR